MQHPNLKDFILLYATMKKPAWIFDGRNCLDHRLLLEIGYNVCGIGKGNLS